MSPLALLTLAQDAAAAPPAAVPAKPWWQILLENGLPLTLLFIFLVAIVGVIVKLRRKDKCLKLLSDYHVTYLTTAGRAIWGDLVVYSQGLELRFDAPYVTRRGLTKSSAMIYEPEMANCLAICRAVDGLTDRERHRRERQVRRSFRPNVIRRSLRWVRNIINTLRDAFSKALTAIIGAVAKARPDATVLTTQQAGVTEIGQTLLGAAANAYEPILEAHIGKPVVLRLTGPAEPTNKSIELPGYLVDYSDKFIAVFNVEHKPEETIELELTDSVERPGVKVELTASDAIVTATGDEVITVKRMASDGRQSDLEVALIPGCQLTLPRTGTGPVKLTLERTRRLDIVCPRALGTVHFGADTEVEQRLAWFGLAPEHAAEARTGVGEPATSPATPPPLQT